MYFACPSLRRRACFRSPSLPFHSTPSLRLLRLLPLARFTLLTSALVIPPIIITVAVIIARRTLSLLAAVAITFSRWPRSDTSSRRLAAQLRQGLARFQRCPTVVTVDVAVGAMFLLCISNFYCSFWARWCLFLPVIEALTLCWRPSPSIRGSINSYPWCLPS